MGDTHRACPLALVRKTDLMSTDVHSNIGDPLASWNGSRDSMHRRPGPTPEEAHAALARMATTLGPVVRAMNEQFAAMARSLSETLIPLARALGCLPPRTPPRPARLDARYHQRQKNRRKRRR